MSNRNVIPGLTASLMICSRELRNRSDDLNQVGVRVDKRGTRAFRESLLTSSFIHKARYPSYLAALSPYTQSNAGLTSRQRFGAFACHSKCNKKNLFPRWAGGVTTNDSLQKLRGYRALRRAFNMSVAYVRWHLRWLVPFSAAHAGGVHTPDAWCGRVGYLFSAPIHVFDNVSPSSLTPNLFLLSSPPLSASCNWFTDWVGERSPLVKANLVPASTF